jgi:hypothetical protein
VKIREEHSALQKGRYEKIYLLNKWLLVIDPAGCVPLSVGSNKMN